MDGIHEAAVRHFGDLFKARDSVNYDDLIWATEALPTMFDEVSAMEFFKPVREKEIMAVLKSLAVDKSPGPDGWTPDFFIHFADILMPHLVEMVEDARTSGQISGDVNSTFLVLVPKKSDAKNFNDYRPISLCNTLYKVISKTIAERMKKMLSRFISPEQSGFLKDKSIHDVVASTQEVIHSIHTKNIKAMVMKIDLCKAYDRVDWRLLRMILFKIGLDRVSVNWIMGFVTNTSMDVIINGVASDFFRPGRGLRQGCALSPLLFILVMDILSCNIGIVVSNGLIKGIKLSYSREISHNLFVMMFYYLA